jgi:hypothetical protein
MYKKHTIYSASNIPEEFYNKQKINKIYNLYNENEVLAQKYNQYHNKI